MEAEIDYITEKISDIQFNIFLAEQVQATGINRRKSLIELTKEKRILTSILAKLYET